MKKHIKKSKKSILCCMVISLLLEFCFPVDLSPFDLRPGSLTRGDQPLPLLQDGLPKSDSQHSDDYAGHSRYSQDLPGIGPDIVLRGLGRLLAWPSPRSSSSANQSLAAFNDSFALACAEAIHSLVWSEVAFFSSSSASLTTVFRFSIILFLVYSHHRPLYQVPAFSSSYEKPLFCARKIQITLRINPTGRHDDPFSSLINPPPKFNLNIFRKWNP